MEKLQIVFSEEEYIVLAQALQVAAELYATDAMRSENEPSVATQFRRQVKRCLELVDRIETIYG